jgi:anti-sigma regulatory factor (Ser/Thr protein kinase)
LEKNDVSLKKLTLHNDVAEVPLLAEWVEQLGEELGLEMPEVFQLNLALEEAVVNVMNYAYEDSGLIDLTAKVVDSEIVFVLEDSGKAFDPTKVDDPDITLSAEDRDIGGLGIFLVQQLMSGVTYSREDGKNVLTMIYKRK